MPVYYDQLQRPVKIDAVPQRIVSLVPSQTELLFDIGVMRQVVGCTKFCVHPAALTSNVTKVGGTKQLNLEQIHALKPDLIIANKEENNREDIEVLMLNYPVWVSDIQSLKQALDMIIALGEITACSQRANALAAVVEQNFKALNNLHPQLHTVYLIWRKPYMAVGSNTFINEMMHYCGLSNAINDSRYPAVDIPFLKQLSPELVILSSEPYPFKQKHIVELQEQLPGAKIILANGEIFSWYGSRLQYVPEYFKQLRGRLNRQIEN